MNYLKKYRKDAGLISTTNENMHCFGAAHQQSTITPTKETLEYLASAMKQGKAHTPVLAKHTSQQAMKTPVRALSPQRKTPSGAKDGRRSNQRNSAIKPFGKVDTNMQQSSSRKSLKHVSSHSKKQQELYNGVINSFRNSTAAASAFNSKVDPRRPTMSALPTSQLYQSS